MDFPHTRYYVKFDNLRRENKWTAVGPLGRIGPDWPTREAALRAIQNETGEVASMKERRQFSFGYIWEVVFER